MENQCVCSGGVPTKGAHCPIDKKEGCERCKDPGLTLSLRRHQCLPNRCVCEDGTPAIGKDCPVNGMLKCKSCLATGFKLIKQRMCRPNRCNCPGGTATTGENCATQNTEQCENCFAPMYSGPKGGKCEIKCVCRNGTPVKGAKCTAAEERCDNMSWWSE